MQLLTRALSWACRAGRRAGGSMIELLYPPHCLLCGGGADDGRFGLCRACDGALGRIAPPACPRCGAALPRALPQRGRTRCGACPRGAFAPDGSVAAARYVGSTRDLVVRLKYGRDRLLARPLGALLAERLGAGDVTFRADLIVPVPLPIRRRLTRGFNQAVDLARAVSRALGVPCAARLVRRRSTPPQAGLRRAERLRNVRSAFSVWPWAQRSIAGRVVLVVDDVLTTGATAGALARTLKRAGARAVYVAVAARAQDADPPS